LFNERKWFQNRNLRSFDNEDVSDDNVDQYDAVEDAVVDDVRSPVDVDSVGGFTLDCVVAPG